MKNKTMLYVGLAAIAFWFWKRRQKALPPRELTEEEAARGGV